MRLVLCPVAMAAMAFVGVVRPVHAASVIATTKDPASRDPRWSVPLTVEGVPNFCRVSPGLYRGAQPSAAGFEALAKMGIKTIVSLRLLHSDDGKLKGIDLGHERFRFFVLHAEEKDLVRFLTIATDPERQPVFVHCLRGADRTGTFVAAYRICVEGWTKDDALAEMTQGGTGFDPRWKNLVRFVRDLDVEHIQTSLKPPPAAAADPSAAAPAP